MRGDLDSDEYDNGTGDGFVHSAVNDDDPFWNWSEPIDLDLELRGGPGDSQ